MLEIPTVTTVTLKKNLVSQTLTQTTTSTVTFSPAATAATSIQRNAKSAKLLPHASENGDSADCVIAVAWQGHTKASWIKALVW